MHPRNRYNNSKPDFVHLASKHAGFSSESDGGKVVNFKNPDFNRQLTCALLAEDFGLFVDLPVDRLVPAVTQRLNYLHWVEDLVAGDAASVPHGEHIRGIDIGTGASAIFSLLAAKINGWSMLATEVDTVSISFAKANVTKNVLEEIVTVVKVAPDEFLLAPLSQPLRADSHFDFCMCNPPFFSSEQEVLSSAGGEGRPPPSAACTGTSREMVAEGGGEVGFVQRILHDSLLLRDRVRWYTSMLGKKSSIAALQKATRQHNVPFVATTEFVQGKTHRWGIAWSFSAGSVQAWQHPLSPHGKRSGKRKHPLEFAVVPAEYASTDRSICMSTLLGKLDAILTELKITFSVSRDRNSSVTHYQCSAWSPSWQHTRKRRRQAQRLAQLSHGDKPLVDEDQQAIQSYSGDSKLSYPDDSTVVVLQESSGASNEHRSTGMEKNAAAVRVAPGRKMVTGETSSGELEALGHSVGDPVMTVPILVFNVCVCDSTSTASLHVEIDCDSQQNRELLHQVYTYLKNRLTSQGGSVD